VILLGTGTSEYAYSLMKSGPAGNLYTSFTGGMALKKYVKK